MMSKLSLYKEARVIHRAMEGNDSRSICGLDYLGGINGVWYKTSYDWNKITCKKCLKDKCNYD